MKRQLANSLCPHRSRLLGRRRWLACCLAGAAVWISGCATYRFGARSLYPADIQTVYVPIFTSNSFRRNLGERLTEAVVREIQTKTPFTVVSSPDADSMLTGRILRDTKRVVVETPTDEPREEEIAFQVQVTWTDRRGGVVQEGTVPLDKSTVDILQSAFVRPEFGYSISTGQQQVIERLAEQIVSLMEAPW